MPLLTHAPVGTCALGHGPNTHAARSRLDRKSNTRHSAGAERRRSRAITPTSRASRWNRTHQFAGHASLRNAALALPRTGQDAPRSRADGRRHQLVRVAEWLARVPRSRTRHSAFARLLAQS